MTFCANPKTPLKNTVGKSVTMTNDGMKTISLLNAGVFRDPGPPRADQQPPSTLRHQESTGGLTGTSGRIHQRQVENKTPHFLFSRRALASRVDDASVFGIVDGVGSHPSRPRRR